MHACTCTLTLSQHLHPPIHHQVYQSNHSLILLSLDLDLLGALDRDLDLLLAPDPAPNPAVRFGVGDRRDLRRLRVLVVLMVVRVSAALLCEFLVSDGGRK